MRERAIFPWGFVGLALLVSACQRQSTTTAQVEHAGSEGPVIQKYGAADLLTAYKAVAGEPVSQEGQDSGQADSGDQTVSEPVTMVDVAPPVVALLVKNTIPNGCHACSGDYSIFYVKKDGPAFDVLGKWPNIGGQGEFGNASDGGSAPT